MKANLRIVTALEEAGISQNELASFLEMPQDIISKLLACDREDEWLSKFGIHASEVFVATARLTQKDVYWLANGK